MRSGTARRVLELVPGPLVARTIRHRHVVPRYTCAECRRTRRDAEASNAATRRRRCSCSRVMLTRVWRRPQGNSLCSPAGAAGAANQGDACAGAPWSYRPKVGNAGNDPHWFLKSRMRKRVTCDVSCAQGSPFGSSVPARLAAKRRRERGDKKKNWCCSNWASACRIQLKRRNGGHSVLASPGGCELGTALAANSQCLGNWPPRRERSLSCLSGARRRQSRERRLVTRCRGWFRRWRVQHARAGHLLDAAGSALAVLGGRRLGSRLQ